MPEGSRVNTETTTSKADVLPESSVRSRSRVEASTSGLRPNESEAAPNTGVVPPVGPSSSSRISAGFEVLGRGLLGHPMEAIKNLIPEGFLAKAGVSSPEKIAQSYFSLSGEFLRPGLHFNQFSVLESEFAYLSFYSSW